MLDWKTIARRIGMNRSRRLALGKLLAASSFVRGLIGLADAAVAVVTPLSVGNGSRIRWVLSERNGAISVHRVKKGRDSLVDRFSTAPEKATNWVREVAAAADVELRLDPDHIVAQTLTLPSDSRDFLNVIIDHRLDRLTPWKPDHVIYGFRILPTPTEADLLDIQFAATSRDRVAEQLQRLEQLGIRPTAIGSAGDPIEEPVIVDLLRGSADRRRLRQRRLLRGAFLASLPLALGAFVISSVLMSQAESNLREVSSTLAQHRRMLLTDSEGNEAERLVHSLLATKTADQAVFLLIDRLAAAIPADAFLNDLEFGSDTIRLHGVSANAPALIPVLEAVPGISHVRFEAPVARESDGRDRFEIVAALDAEPGKDNRP